MAERRAATGSAGGTSVGVNPRKAPTRGGGTPVGPRTGTLPDWWALLYGKLPPSLQPQDPTKNAIASKDRLPLAYGKVRPQCRATSWLPVPGSEMYWLKAVISVCEGEIEEITKFYISTLEMPPGHYHWPNTEETDVNHYHGVTGEGISGYFPPWYVTTNYTNVAHIGLQIIGNAGGIEWWRILPSYSEDQELIFTADIKGRKIYDPRPTPQTVYSNNPALIIRDLLVTYGGTPTAAISDTSFPHPEELRFLPRAAVGAVQGPAQLTREPAGRRSGLSSPPCPARVTVQNRNR